jgi:periplasmic protein CpxP/Spy
MKKMKKLFLALLLLVGITTWAQGKRERRPEGDRLTKEEKVDLQVKRMTKDLDLNEKQAKEVRTLVTKEVEKREAKRAEMTEEKKVKREAMKTEMKEAQAAHSAERDERKDKLKERMAERRGKGKPTPEE